ncbi:MAG TPA: NADP-dependent oxidoreductase, partial [Mycobacterium sp.]|nr:NADP-dependent oxidoreductase [Mycobacterium sp.]
MIKTQQVQLAKRPVGLPDADTWSVATEELSAICAGEILVKVNLIPIDPAMRGWLNDARSYLPPVGIGE